MKILLVEDDPKIRQELKVLLENNQYDIAMIEDFTKDITEEINKIEKDLILLDINLPNQNGFDICKKIKEKESVPIIFVTSCTGEESELKSILSGGEDFITKPYNKDILLEKIKRTIKKQNPIQYKEINVNGVTLDLHLSIIKNGDKQTELTRNEFRILYYFFMSEEEIISKEELLEKLWNDKCYLDENVLLVNMTRLKKKMREIGVVHLLENVRGKGWKL